jgi:hypothetical protein
MPDDDYTPLHARFEDDTTVADAPDPSQISDDEVRRRCEHALQSATRLAEDLRLVRQYLGGNIEESDVWADVDGLPSGGMTGTPAPNVTTAALRRCKTRSERIRRDVVTLYLTQWMRERLNDAA